MSEQITMSFNSIDTSPLLKVLKVKRQIGNERSVTSNSSPKLGILLQKVKTDAKIIEVEVSLTSFDISKISFVDTIHPSNIAFGNINKIREQVAGLFNQEEERMLVFSDEPDRYYNAILIDKTELSGIQTWYDTAKLTFLIPDGVAHSISYKKITDFTESDGKVVFNITNNGNVEALPIVTAKMNSENGYFRLVNPIEALPIITAKMNSENGYFGLVNSTGVMEIGDREIIDSETRQFSERPFDYTDSGTKILDGLSKSQRNVAISNDSTTILDNTLGTLSWLGRDHVALTKTMPNGNHASSMTFDLPSAGSLFDRIWWRQIFHIGDPGQFGYIKILVSDTDGKFLYGVETMKRKQGYDAEYNFMVADGKGGYKVTDFNKTFTANEKDSGKFLYGVETMKRKQGYDAEYNFMVADGKGGYKVTDFNKTFTANEKDSDNPFNDNRGFSDLIRQDDQVQIYWFGSHIKRTFSELKGKKSAKLHVIIGSLAGKPLVTRMYLDGIKYQKDNVAFGYNIPNPYGKGSTVVINGENKTFLVDNIAKLNHVVDYSKWLKIPVGTSTLEISTSSWNELKPTFNVAFEERWL